MTKRSLFNQVVFALSLLGAGALLVRFVIAPMEPTVYTDGNSRLDSGSWSGARRVVWNEPDLVALASSGDAEADPALASDGRSLYYTVGMPGGLADLWVADLALDGTVLDSRPLDGVNSPYDDRDPFATDEGLFFASDRPGGSGGLDIWFARREGDGFGSPIVFSAGVNTGADERSPSLDAASMQLAFASDRNRLKTSAAIGAGYDLFLATRVRPEALDGDSFGDPIEPPILNSEFDDLDPTLSADGNRILFATNRDGGAGGYDLWWSLWTGQTWLEARPLETVNTEHDELAPHTSDRGFSLVFASNRPTGPGLTDLYRATSYELFPLPGERSWLDVFAEGLIILLLLLALAAFLANRWSKLDIVVKCILISILVHLLLMLWFRTVELEGVLEEPSKVDSTHKIHFLSSADDRRPPEEANRARSGDIDALARAESPEEASERFEIEVPREEASAQGWEGELDERPVEVDATRVAAIADAALPPSRRIERALEVERGERSGEADPSRTFVESSVESQRRESETTGERIDHALAAVESPAAQAASFELPRSTVANTMTPRRDATTPSRPDRSDLPRSSVERVTPLQTEAPSERIAEADPERTVEIPDGVSVARRETGPSPASARSTSEALRESLRASDAAPSEPAPAETARPALAAAGGSEAAARTGRSARVLELPRSRPAGPSRRSLAVGAPDRVAPAAGEEAAPEPAIVASRAIRTERSTRPLEASRGVARDLASRTVTEPVDTRVARADLPALDGRVGLPERSTGRPALAASRTVAKRPTASRLTAPALETPAIADADRRRRTDAARSADRQAPERTSPMSAVAKLEPLRRRSTEPARRSVFEATRGAAAALASASAARSVLPDLTPTRGRSSVRRTPAASLEGVYSRRTTAGKALALEEFGGTAESERAVQRGLAYLASTQNRDGSWGREEYDNKYERVQVGKSGLALLAFLASGHTQFSETNFTPNVKRALAFLLSVQDDRTGHFGLTSSYSHGIATYALAEAYAMTHDRALREPLARGVAWILSNQYLDRRERAWFGGWGYFYPDRRRISDTWPRASVTVWQVMALKSAQIGGIEFPEEHLEAARIYLLNSYDQDRRAFRYSHDPRRLSTRWPILPASTPASVFGLLLLGEDPNDPRIEQGLRYVHERSPQEYERGSDDDFVFDAVGNLYFWYYGTLAMFLRGEEHWAAWNENLRDLLVDAQNEDGSWTPISAYARYALDTRGERDYTTAMNVLMLEVYYRYFTPLLEGE